MSTELLKKAFSGVIHKYTAGIARLIFGALTSIYVIRKLTVEDYGIFNFATSLFAVAAVITSFGLSITVQRYLPEYREKKNSYLQKRLLSAAMLIRLTSALAFVLIILLANNRIINIFHLPGYFKDFLPLLSLIILFALEADLLGQGCLMALLENRYWNFSRIAYQCLKLVLFFIALSRGYGVYGILWGWLFVEIFLFLLYMFKAYKTVFLLPTQKADIQPLPIRRLFNFSKYLILQQTTWLFRDRAVDIFLISYFLGLREVGQYAFAFGIPLMIMSFSPGSMLRGVFTPLLVRSYTRKNDKEQLIYFFELTNKIIFFVMIPLFVTLMILADKLIIYVFNPEYLKVKYIFILSFGFVMIQQFAYPYGALLYTLEKTKAIFIGSLFAFYNLIMDIILIPPLGVLGAILATGSAGAMLPVYYHFAIKREEGINLKYPVKAFMKFSINILVMAVVVVFLRGFANSIASVIFVMIIAGLVFLGLSYLNKGFGNKDREILNKAIGKKIWVF